ncbi:MAG: lipopolysaccharide kinase InaA family protein [Zoogloeaceae bacterium]|jgi:hypothetical protein|nr:lipopolysaccharide kinase InaA family protein [Zoogloeaceae bacterium]
MNKTRPDFFADADRVILATSGLDNFEALWNFSPEAEDTPNGERGDQRLASRLALPGRLYYLKRQTNHLTRSLSHPLGEPAIAREFRNITRCKERGVPAVEAAFYGERREQNEQGQPIWRAILLTRALDADEGWLSLENWMAGWAALPEALRQDLLIACGKLASSLHGAGLVHGSFYPRHIFLHKQLEGFAARLIALEKTRGFWFPMRNRLRDMAQFARYAPDLSEAEIRFLLGVYLDASPDSAATMRFLKRVRTRQRQKEGRA